MTQIEKNLNDISRKAKLLNTAYESFLNTDIIKLCEDTLELIKSEKPIKDDK